MTPHIIESLDAFLKILAADALNSVHGKLSLFRGQQNATWPVRPSIVRKPSPPEPVSSDPDNPDRKSLESRMLIVFGDEAVPLLPEWTWIGSVAEIKWKRVLIAQHYRLPTRLLDWSTNPLVGLYFAVEGQTYDCSDECKSNHPQWYPEHAGKHHSAVFVLKGHDSFSVSSLAISSPNPPMYIGKNDPGVIRPPAFDRRIMAQGSLFTISATPDKPIIPDHVLLIEDKDRKKILHQLDVCGVNEKTLFPDLEHLGQYLKQTSTRWH